MTQDILGALQNGASEGAMAQVRVRPRPACTPVRPERRLLPAPVTLSNGGALHHVLVECGDPRRDH